MNKQELIEALRREADSLESLKTNAGDWKAEGIHEAMGLAMQLDDPPAMAWQDEPNEANKDGESHEYRVRGHGVTEIRWDGDQWLWLVYFDPRQSWQIPFWEPLSGRRVCPVPPPPPLPERAKGGDA